MRSIKMVLTLSRLPHNAGNSSPRFWVWYIATSPSSPSHFFRAICQASSVVSRETLSAFCHRSLALGATLPLTKTNAAIFLAAVIAPFSIQALGRSTDTPQTPTATTSSLKHELRLRLLTRRRETLAARWCGLILAGVTSPFRPIVQSLDSLTDKEA